MNGKYVLDTNAVVALLQGNKNIQAQIAHADWLGISVITYLEFLAFPNLSKQDENLFSQFLSRVQTIPLSKDDLTCVEAILQIRKTRSVKLPDAIIAATALSCEATLITADTGFLSIPQLSVFSF